MGAKMSSYKWKRYNISLDEYKKLMGLNTKKSDMKKDDSKEDLKKVKYEKAYEAAEKIRQFEIGLFWKRATFFWAFITAIYTAYFNVLTKIYKYKCDDITLYKHGTIPLIILSALGLFFCFSWLLSSIGSKHWQENWEKHLDLLENKVTGPLYKTYEAGKAYSESKITIAAGWIVTICSYGLLLFEFMSMLICKLRRDRPIFIFYCFISFAIIVIVLLFAYSVVVTGNTKNEGEFEFQIKVYEGLEDA